MSTDLHKAPVVSYSHSDYEQAVVNSSLWAAAGDALGWITEFSQGAKGVRRRTGKERVTEPVRWQRFIGGRSGVKVDLPAGTYSDDTQLRLCVSRSIRGNGAFDVESFAKIEVTSWQGYCLGAGISSKAAAINLSKRGVNWFSNFFASDRRDYTAAGGNGAAMRIQPHVWSANGSRDEMVLCVIRDAIVTHGHPHGFCGAVFHALCIWNVLAMRRIPSLENAEQFVSFMDRLPSILEKDYELAVFWKPTWERKTGGSFKDAVLTFQKEALQDISLIKDVIDTSMVPDYRDILRRLGCFTDKYRGSGFKTALAALILSSLYQPKEIAEALIRVANEFDSDTDTIATMTGALLGILAKQEPSWKVQDIEYLRSEAKRMVDIASGKIASSFPYPDVTLWKPPTNQSDAVVMWKGALALTGFGVLEPQGQEYSSGTSVWQWLRLPFGQSVLAKRRSKVQSVIDENQMPREQLLLEVKSQKVYGEVKNKFSSFINRENSDESRTENAPLITTENKAFYDLDEATDIVIASNFDNATLGRIINQCIDKTGRIDLVTDLSAIIAKARLVRIKRKQSQT